MKPSKLAWLAWLAWLEWLAGIFDWQIVHHRTCRLCREHILKAHKYRHVKVGPFWVDRVEHKDCKNPTLETPYQLAARLGPELPFDRPVQGPPDEAATHSADEFNEEQKGSMIQ